MEKDLVAMDFEEVEERFGLKKGDEEYEAAILVEDLFGEMVSTIDNRWVWVDRHGQGRLVIGPLERDKDNMKEVREIDLLGHKPLNISIV